MPPPTLTPPPGGAQSYSGSTLSVPTGPHYGGSATPPTPAPYQVPSWKDFTGTLGGTPAPSAVAPSMGAAPGPWQPLAGAPVNPPKPTPTNTPQTGWGQYADKLKNTYLGASDAMGGAFDKAKQWVGASAGLTAKAVADPVGTYGQVRQFLTPTPNTTPPSPTTGNPLDSGSSYDQLSRQQQAEGAPALTPRPVDVQGMSENAQPDNSWLEHYWTELNRNYKVPVTPPSLGGLSADVTPLEVAGSLAAGPVVGRAIPAVASAGPITRTALNSVRVPAEAVTGIGAVRNLVAGTGKMVGGALTGNGRAVGQGFVQAAVKAPMYGMVPSGMAGATMRLSPEFDASGNPVQTPANRFLAPPGQEPGYAARLSMPAWMIMRSLGVPGTNAPSLPEYVQQNLLQNAVQLGDAAANQFPAFRRAVGNFATDTANAFRHGDPTSPANVYADQQRRFGELAASGKLTPESAEQIRDIVGGLDHATPEGYDSARQQLVFQELKKQLEEKYPVGHPLRAQLDETLRQSGLDPAAHVGKRLTYPTARDLESARVTAGMLPGPTQAQSAKAFSTEIDKLMAALDPGGIPSPAALTPQPTAGPASLPPAVSETPPVDPEAASRGPGTGTTPPGEDKPTSIAQGDAAVGGVNPQELQQAGKNLQQIAGNPAEPGFWERAAQKAQVAPPPQGFEKYWDGLDRESKILAIAGLSLTAITALKSMFGSKDDDEEGGGSWLMSALPFLGLGAAAWGAGGGTFSKLPQMSKYKDLGDSVTQSLGINSLFN